MSEFQVGTYVYFGGNQRSFRILRRDGDEIEIHVGQGPEGKAKTRTLSIVRDSVTTAPPNLGTIQGQGFRPGVRFRAVRA